MASACLKPSMLRSGRASKDIPVAPNIWAPATARGFPNIFDTRASHSETLDWIKAFDQDEGAVPTTVASG
jgi:hypothetical protein